MKVSKTLIVLSWLIVLLTVVATGVGLLWTGGSGPYSFTTHRGTTAEIYGRGLYQYDSLLAGAGFRGIDVVLLFVAVPVLAWATVWYQRGSLRGAFLLLGMTGFFLYNYGSMALGAAYNALFVLYVALFSAGLFAFVLAFTTIDQKRLPTHILAHMPHRALAIFMFATGLVFLVVWLGVGILLPRSQGQPPEELASYTTLVTHVLDLGVLMPTALLAGILLRRRAPLGYLLAFVILVIGIFVVGLSVPAATVSQLLAGYAFTPVQAVAFIGSFVLLGVIAMGLAVAFLRNLEDDTP